MKHSNHSSILAVLLILTALVAGGASYHVGKVVGWKHAKYAVAKAPKPYDGWQTFSDGPRAFSFRYPQGYVASVPKTLKDTAKKAVVTIAPAPTKENPTPLPVMTVTVDRSLGTVAFALHEKLAWNYYDEVVRSYVSDFENEKPAAKK